MPDGREPPVWFHDIFRKDGTAYDKKEVTLIREVTMSEDEPVPAR